MPTAEVTPAQQTYAYYIKVNKVIHMRHGQYYSSFITRIIMINIKLICVMFINATITELGCLNNISWKSNASKLQRLSNCTLAYCKIAFDLFVCINYMVSPFHKYTIT